MKLEVGVICDKCGRVFKPSEGSEILVIPNRHHESIHINSNTNVTEVGDICDSCLVIFNEVAESFFSHKDKDFNLLKTFIGELNNHVKEHPITINTHVQYYDSCHDREPILGNTSSDSHVVNKRELIMYRSECNTTSIIPKCMEGYESDL